jgi:hypothetical protein
MGEWRYTSTVLNLDITWGDWSASRLGWFTIGEKAPVSIELILFILMFLFGMVVETTELFWPENLKGKDLGWPPLWFNGQCSWLQMQRSGFDSRRYQIFWLVVGLERGPLSLVSTTEELLERTSSGSGLENREYSRGDLLRWPCDTLYPQKLALTLPSSGGRSVGIVR